MWGVDLLEKTLVLGKIESRRRTEQQRMSWMYGNTNSMDMSFEHTESYWRTGEPGMLQSTGLQSQTRHSNWTTTVMKSDLSNDNLSVKGSNWHNLLMCVCVFSHFIHAQLFAVPWTVACQASLLMEFFRQEYWRGLPFPSPGNLPDPGIEPMSPELQENSLPLSHQGSPICLIITY